MNTSFLLVFLKNITQALIYPLIHKYSQTPNK